MNKSDQQIMEKLVSAMHSVYLDRRKLFIRSFLSGLFTAIGATLGFSLFLILLTVIIHFLGGLPGIGSFFTELGNFITSATHK